MNIKNIRKNYRTLNEWERLSLFISAVVRGDKSEEAAIMAALPIVVWEKVDFAVLYEKVLTLQMAVIIHKANSWTNWQTFSQLETEKADEHSRLALYYFYVYHDAWVSVCEEIKIDPNALGQAMFPESFFISRIVLLDEFFRELAFTEDEARDFIKRFAGQEAELEMTLENITNSYRRILDLPEK